MHKKMLIPGLKKNKIKNYNFFFFYKIFDIPNNMKGMLKRKPLIFLLLWKKYDNVHEPYN